MTPPELMLASLGSCAGYYAVDYLKRQTSPLWNAGTSHGGKSKKSARLDNFKIEVDVPAA